MTDRAVAGLFFLALFTLGLGFICAWPRGETFEGWTFLGWAFLCVGGAILGWVAHECKA